MSIYNLLYLPQVCLLDIHTGRLYHQLLTSDNEDGFRAMQAHIHPGEMFVQSDDWLRTVHSRPAGRRLIACFPTEGLGDWQQAPGGRWWAGHEGNHLTLVGLE